MSIEQHEVKVGTGSRIVTISVDDKLSKDDAEASRKSQLEDAAARLGGPVAEKA